MLAAHYAPRARVVLADDGQAAAVVAGLLDGPDRPSGVGLLAPGVVPGVPDDAVVLEPAGPAEEYARLLYARLRQADRLGLDVLVCVPPPAVGIGVAVVDRLRRAAAGSAPPASTAGR
jgi:L-threonylcarbamoyladenylate synthase